MAMRFIPKKLRHSYYRKSATKAFRAQDDVIFKIASTQSEIEEAFRLIYQVQLSKKLVLPQSSEMILSKIHALPTTKILVAVQNKKVVSAVCLSLEGPIRTSCEEHFDLGSLKLQERCFVEVSNFVVDPHCKEDFRSFLFPLCKLALDLNKVFFKADYLVTAVPADDFDYWHSLFLFDKHSEKVVKSQAFHSKPTICAFAEAKTIEEKFLHRYGRKSKVHNLHHYLFVQVDSRVQVPPSEEIVREKYSPEMLDYFFNRKSTVFADLTSFEARTLKKIYDEPQYQEILPNAVSRTKFENHRNVKRYHAHLSGRLEQDNSDSSSITIKTVSLHGLGGICNHKLIADKTYQMKIDVGNESQIALLVSPVWSSRDNTYGFVIRGKNPEWIEFIENFQKLDRQAS